jgi:hypothetical protein
LEHLLSIYSAPLSQLLGFTQQHIAALETNNATSAIGMPVKLNPRRSDRPVMAVETPGRLDVISAD